ncbi:MAG: UvrD-helicase domain-containing protein [Fretibacterium sp.]|nr:UvrD-helicase domain-containing protein [Fretibacterium sp.]
MTQLQESQRWIKDLLPPETPEGQRRAVEEDAPLIAVDAGAGTGKTWVLSTRFSRLLFSEPDCLPRHILTLTFTEAAANEMQERIQARTEELILKAGESLSPERSQAILEGFDENWISTIHSFSARLIRDSGLALDIDPQSAVISQPQTEAFWQEFERALDFLSLKEFAQAFGTKTQQELASELDSDPVLCAALSLWKASDLRTLAEGVAELHASQGHSPNSLLEWAEEAERDDIPQAAQVRKQQAEQIKPLLEETWETWKRIFSELHEPIQSGALEQFKKNKPNAPEVLLQALLERWSPMSPEPSYEELRAFFLEAGALKGKSSNLFTAIKERLGNTVGKWANSLELPLALSVLSPSEPLPEEERRLRATLLRLCALAWSLWDETKRHHGLLSFTDMIRYARDSVFEGHRPKGFRHVLVDEFQDTDPLQFSLIEKLREKEGARLFAVGDPKQSIYRFRHADLRLFAETAAHADSRVTLDLSFRTRRALLDRLNKLFAHIWKEGLGARPPMQNLSFTPLKAAPPRREAPERDEGTMPPYTLLVTLKEGRKSATSDLAQQLAQTLTGCIARELTVWDKQKGELRPVRWKDCTVLVRTRSANTHLEAAFQEAGIPFVFEKNTDFLSRGEVNDVISLLRAVSDFDDDAALAGWLSSPLSGVPQNRAVECIMMTSSARTSRFYDVMQEVLPEAAEKLRRLRALGALKGPASALAELLKDRRWLTDYDKSYRVRAVRNVVHALMLVREYEALSLSLAGCARWLEIALRREAKITSPSAAAPEADVVTITTIHASKGLEYPVTAVFCADSRARSNPLTPSKELGLTFSSLPDPLQPEEGEKAEPYLHIVEKALEQEEALEEDQRLFYVAATRARDALFLCGAVGLTHDKGKEKLNLPKNNWTSWALTQLMEQENCDDALQLQDEAVCFNLPSEERLKSLSSDREDEEENEEEEAAEGTEVAENAPLRKLPLPDPKNLSLSSLSATSFALHHWCPLAWRRRHRQGLDLRWELPDGEEEQVGGAEVGSLAHWVLARWNLDEDELGLWLRGERTLARLDASLRETWRDEKAKANLEQRLSALSTSELGKILRDAIDGGAQRESSFSISVGEDPQVALIGAMDVLWQDAETPGAWHILDYKITTADTAPVPLYTEQLAFYALALRLLTQKKELPFSSVEVGLLFLNETPELRHRMLFSENYDWETLSQRALHTAQEAATGAWPPRLEHCRLCPWALRCPQRA